MSEKHEIEVRLLSLAPIFGKISLYAGIAQLARASPCQGEGREFESRFPLTSIKNHLYGDFLLKRMQIENRTCRRCDGTEARSEAS